MVCLEEHSCYIYIGAAQRPRAYMATFFSLRAVCEQFDDPVFAKAMHLAKTPAAVRHCAETAAAVVGQVVSIDPDNDALNADYKQLMTRLSHRHNHGGGLSAAFSALRDQVKSQKQSRADVLLQISADRAKRAKTQAL